MLRSSSRSRSGNRRAGELSCQENKVIGRGKKEVVKQLFLSNKLMKRMLELDFIFLKNIIPHTWVSESYAVLITLIFLFAD